MKKTKAKGAPEVALCTYRVKPGKERQFLKLLAVHWPTLKKVGLVAPRPRLLFRGRDQGAKTFFVEIFAWKNSGAARFAHQFPEVMAIWEPMEQLCEERLGRPAMEFPHVQPLE